MSCGSLGKLPTALDKTTRHLPSHGRHQLRMHSQRRGEKSRRAGEALRAASISLPPTQFPDVGT
jgi:hypothetical protein